MKQVVNTVARRAKGRDVFHVSPIVDGPRIWDALTWSSWRESIHPLPMSEWIFVTAYLGVGIAVAIGLWKWFRKTEVDRKVLRFLWVDSLGGDLGFILVPVLWPLIALFSVLWWLVEYWSLCTKKKWAREKAEELKGATKFSSLSMDELMRAQKEMLDRLENRK